MHLSACLMFLTGSMDELDDRIFITVVHPIPVFNQMIIHADEALFLDGDRIMDRVELERRLWKYYRQRDDVLRKIGQLADTIMTGEADEELPRPAITDVDAPEGFWALVTGSVVDASETGLIRDESGRIIGIQPYIFVCRAEIVVFEVSPDPKRF